MQLKIDLRAAQGLAQRPSLTHKEKMGRERMNAQYRVLGPKSFCANEGRGKGFQAHPPSVEVIRMYLEGVLEYWKTTTLRTQPSGNGKEWLDC